MTVWWSLLGYVLDAEFLLLLVRLAAFLGNVDPLVEDDVVSADGVSLTLRRRVTKGRTVWTALTAFYSIHIAKDSTAGWCAYIWHRERDELLVVLQTYYTVELASAACSEWIRARQSSLPGGKADDPGNVPPQTDAAPWNNKPNGPLEQQTERPVVLSYYARKGRADHKRLVDMARAQAVIASHDRIANKMDSYARRRRAELRLVESFEDSPFLWMEPRLESFLSRMKTCRHKGIVGTRPDGRPVVAWHSKCDCLRLCPDEARQDQARVIQTYFEMILGAMRAPPLRVYKGVFTMPNVPQGQLHEAKRRIFKEFAAWRKAIGRKVLGCLVVLQTYYTVELASAACSEWIRARQSSLPGGKADDPGNVPPQTDAAPWNNKPNGQ